MEHAREAIGHASRGDLAALKLSHQAHGSEVVLGLVDPDQLTALHAAAAGGHVECITYLLEQAGGDPGVARLNNFTPLHAAAMSGHTAACGVLLDAGADPNVQTDPQGYAPLHSAAFAGHVETIRLLLARGADSSLRNYRDEHPADTARRQQQSKAVAELGG